MKNKTFIFFMVLVLSSFALIVTGCASPKTPASIIIKDVEYGTELKKLDLSSHGLNNSDIMPLIHMKNLTTLWLHWNNITDISVLGNLTDLTILGIGGIGLGDDINADLPPLDISVVKNLTNLQELWLEFNKIEDISVLAGLTNLTKLSLHNTNISDISALKDLKNLEELIISSNYITDVEILKEFKNLTRLDIYRNQIGDKQIEELKIALPNCQIRITGQEKIENNSQ